MTKRAARWIWLDDVRNHVRDGTLTSNAGWVAHTLGVHYMNGGREAWPSQTELAQTTGLGKRTVRRAIDELQQTGLLNVRHGPPAHGFGNVYQLPTRPHRPPRPQA